MNKRMITLLCFALILPEGACYSASSTGSIGSGSLDIGSILQSVRSAETSIKDISFSFVQKTSLKGAGDAQEVRGKIVMTRNPERFRVDYESPVRQVAIYDGRTLMLYMPETGQAFRQKTSDLDLKKLLGFDPTAPLGLFEGKYSPELLGCDAGTCRVSFKAGDKAGTSWIMALDTGNWLVDEISFENSDMSMSIICSNYRTNRGVKAKTFRFRLPPDTEVIDGIPMLMGPGKVP